MKRSLLLSAILTLSVATHSFAAVFFNSGSTGALGAFNPTANTTVQLPANGVLNYTTINIPTGVTVTFTRNAANTPVYMLATGDVTIAGTIDVSGSYAGSPQVVGSGGPGGFDGGRQQARGLGPGGGMPGTSTCIFGSGAGHSTSGAQPANLGTSCGAAGSTYGNAELQPLMGGSGGGGFYSEDYSGGGGGGAILVASSGKVTITGAINASGGRGGNAGGGGSGGSIRIVANTISGNGALVITGGAGPRGGNDGGAGRIRLEAYATDRTVGPVYVTAKPAPVFLTSMPKLTITSIGGIAVPSSPVGSYAQPDVWLSGTVTNPVAVVISGANIPVGTTVNVSVVPQYSVSSSTTATLSGTQTSSSATASVNLPTSGNYASVIMAQATFPLSITAYYEGEKIEKVRIAAKAGSGSETVYITESGREIRAELVALADKLY
jgi:hypothetical protein